MTRPTGPVHVDDRIPVVRLKRQNPTKIGLFWPALAGVGRTDSRMVTTAKLPGFVAWQQFKEPAPTSEAFGRGSGGETGFR
jgi:hypothetical protein